MDVLNIDPSAAETTILADLSVREQIPDSVFDCFICTQTLHFIYDIRSAVENGHRLLKPGGVLLATLPCVSRIAPEEKEDHWRLTFDSCSRLFAEIFGAGNVGVEIYGNLAACVGFLQGVTAEEMSRKQLDKVDEVFPLTLCVRAIKAE
jgi:ubiquinone/menaquinone biosynthesis C-methylase UbiE